MYITSTGMVCSVGLSAAAACAAMRAGITGFYELPYHDGRDNSIVGAVVQGLAPGLQLKERLIAMLSMALADCLRERASESLEKVPLLVGLAELERPGGHAGMAEAIIDEVEQRLGVRFHPTLTRYIPQGHTSGFHGLRVAREILQNAHLAGCLVCGVDSYIDTSSLRWLNQHWRLKTDQNSDGVIPGEAAAAVLVQQQEPVRAQPRVKISGLGFGHEKADVLSEEPLLGLGLAAAARAALAEAEIQMYEIDFRLSDATGESYGFKEQALAVARLLRARREELPIWHCADAIGDMGAAAGFCQLVIAFHAFVKHYAPGNRVICYTSALRGDRAVAVLEDQDGPDGSSLLIPACDMHR